ncbi:MULTISPECIES: uridine kinase family protein [unclassified Micromonospora]|uniref:uridine kinase family protein n=1 Tax=unclassified Micromonospora TaxID=2617518 RepID=UPI003A8A9686
MTRGISTFESLARRVYAAPARLGRVRLVVVDGPSGAGKSTFADRLATACATITATAPESATEPFSTAADPAVAVVHTDDLLDGWRDQFTFWPRLSTCVLDPLRTGRPARYRRYDWAAGRFGDGWTVIEPPAVLVIEGVSAARAAVRPAATLSVYVTAPESVRLARSLTRDGAAIQPTLDRWRRAEERFISADGTPGAVDLLVDGAAEPESGQLRSGQLAYGWIRDWPDVDAGGAGGAPSAG